MDVMLQPCTAVDVSAIRREGIQDSDPVRLREAAREFEALLLRQVFAQMRQSVIPSDLERPSATKAIYHDLMDATVADQISRSGMLGLARALETQLMPPARESAKEAEHAPVPKSTRAADGASSS